MSPALAGRLLTTAPPGKSHKPRLLFKIFLFIYVCTYVCMLCLSALGLRCCVQAFSSCGERGLLFVAVRGLLIAVASLVVGHGLEARGLQ